MHITASANNGETEKGWVNTLWSRSSSPIGLSALENAGKEADCSIQETEEDEKRLDGQKSQPRNLAIWITVNIVSTVSIIFTNKSIFAHESFSHCQMAFAAYHFCITGLTLWALSRPWCGAFRSKPIPIYQIMPLVALMSSQVILQNLSLAFSSVILHQLVRLLLTPATVILNFLLYGVTIPSASIAPLATLCFGVGVVTYYDSLPASGSVETAPTSSKGVLFALAGVLASSLYTALIARYHRNFELNSMQLLLNQAPVATVLLACVAPFVEGPPAMVPSSLWGSIVMSGILACLVNVSQFYIIDGIGPVSSTVIGHLKTCIVVGLGWALSERPVLRQSIGGVMIALVGMTLYMKVVARGGAQ